MPLRGSVQFKTIYPGIVILTTIIVFPFNHSDQHHHYTIKFFYCDCYHTWHPFIAHIPERTNQPCHAVCMSLLLLMVMRWCPFIRACVGVHCIKWYWIIKANRSSPEKLKLHCPLKLISQPIDGIGEQADTQRESGQPVFQGMIERGKGQHWKCSTVVNLIRYLSSSCLWHHRNNKYTYDGWCST